MTAIQEPYTCTIGEFSSSDDALYPERISGDGTIAVTWYRVNQIDFEVRAFKWDIDSLSWTKHGEPIKDQVSPADPTWNIGLSADGSHLSLYATGYDDHIRFFRFEGADWKQIGKTLERMYLPRESLSGEESLSGNGHVVATEKEIYEWDSSNWQTKGQLAPEFSLGKNVALSFNGSILASGAQVYQFSNGWVPMGEPAISLNNPNNHEVVQGVVLSPNGRRLAVASKNSNGSVGPIYVFEFDGAAWVPLGQAVEPIRNQHNVFWDMTFSGTILTYDSTTWKGGEHYMQKHKHYMQVFYLHGKKWVEMEGDRWEGSFISRAAVANECLVSFLGTTDEGISTVYRVACRPIPSQRNNWLRFTNMVVPLVIVSLLFQRMMKQTPKRRHSVVELEELEVTGLK